MKALLSELKPGDNFKLIKVKAAKEIGKRLADMGFVNGVAGTVVRIAPAGDPIEVSILDYNISIRKAEAKEILVETERRIL